ncbi:hypothetical protein MPOCJGCO_3456 [Methylobacterium trifolii]|uniref:Secreted protein n=1 Tax=Methylobacterium trifolii TaxID=1003092 RepID=A0ABQ4U1J2_9HYPH|nr:hypothetical protein MPOCJGCO_3456 [Methylobacterium trifolii]
MRLSSKGVGPVGSGGRVGGGGGATESSLVMVPVAVAVAIVPKFWPESVTVKPSSGSTVASPATSTKRVWLVCPCAKLTEPVGRVPPAKSEASAAARPATPPPLTAYETVCAAWASPLRVTVKL